MTPRVAAPVRSWPVARSSGGAADPARQGDWTGVVATAMAHANHAASGLASGQRVSAQINFRDKG